jgi:hypothetical protein
MKNLQLKNNEIFEGFNIENLEIKNLLQENEIMKKLSTRKGFFSYYFETLKNCTSNEMAFDKVNELYFNLFGEKRYNSYSDFIGTIN